MKMKRSSIWFVALVTAALAFAGNTRAVASPASQSEEAPAAPTNRLLTIDGTASMVGKWSCGGDANVRLEPDPSAAPVPGLSGGVRAVIVTTSVSAIECGHKKMNEHLQTALKTKENPEIRYRADRYTLMEDGAAVLASGQITIAGVTKPIEFGAKLIPLPEGGLRVVGNVEIDMLDFGVKPPSLFLGALKVKNVVVVKFNTVVRTPTEVAQTRLSELK